MPLRRIYLDNNATTAVFPEVADCVRTHMLGAFANPGSQHSFGRDARRVLEDSREQIAAILDADASEVIFTSGGTESLNMAIYGLTFGRSGAIAMTAGEHPATTQACQRARQSGFDIFTLGVDQQGRLQPDQFSQLPWSQLKLVNVILAHNETGVIQDVAELSSLCQQHRVPLLLDAVQAVGKIPVSFRQLGATALAFGAHKFHGPRGVGGLLLRRGTRLVPFLEGGHQENGRRAGTEAVPLIAGMAKALELWHCEQEQRISSIQALRDRLQAELTRCCSPLIVHAENSRRLPNTLSVAFPGIPGEPLLVNLHLQEMACSLGSTCASGSAEAAPALLAMGLSPEICTSSVRLTLSILNSQQDVDDAVSRIHEVVSRMRRESSNGNGPVSTDGGCGNE